MQWTTAKTSRSINENRKYFRRRQQQAVSRRLYLTWNLLTPPKQSMLDSIRSYDGVWNIYDQVSENLLSPYMRKGSSDQRRTMIGQYHWHLIKKHCKNGEVAAFARKSSLLHDSVAQAMTLSYSEDDYDELEQAPSGEIHRRIKFNWFLFSRIIATYSGPRLVPPINNNVIWKVQETTDTSHD